MAKQCNHPSCSRPIFSHGYCGMHQRDRTDEKWIKTQEKAKEKRKTAIKQKPKEGTGEQELFLDIWYRSAKRSWLTGKDLTRYGPGMQFGNLFVNLFHHVLNKKNYSRYRLEEKNIILLTPQEHLDIHSLGREELEKKYEKEAIERYFDLWSNLKEKYNDPGL